MLGRKRYRFAEAQFIGFETAVFLKFSFAFVGKQNHRFVRTSQDIGKMLVVRLNTGAGVKQKQTDIGLVNSFAGLFPHPGFEVVFI